MFFADQLMYKSVTKVWIFFFFREVRTVSETARPLCVSFNAGSSVTGRKGRKKRTSMICYTAKDGDVAYHRSWGRKQEGHYCFGKFHSVSVVFPAALGGPFWENRIRQNKSKQMVKTKHQFNFFSRRIFRHCQDDVIQLSTSVKPERDHR